VIWDLALGLVLDPELDFPPESEGMPKHVFKRTRDLGPDIGSGIGSDLGSGIGPSIGFTPEFEGMPKRIPKPERKSERTS
jgi:hypothetical protein